MLSIMLVYETGTRAHFVLGRQMFFSCLPCAAKYNKILVFTIFVISHFIQIIIIVKE